MKIRKVLCITLCLILMIGAIPASAATTIDTVMVFDVDEPVNGADFDRNATIQSGKGYEIFSQPEWYDETDKKFLEIGDTFKTGHVYTVNVWLEATDGYEFASTTTTTDVTATLNGKGAKAGKAYEYQRWAMVVVSYTFPAVSTGKPVGAISIEIPKPVPGEEASFDAKLTAEGAKMMTKIPDLASIYQDAINGVRWKDNTANRRLNEGDTFIVGHSYTLSVFLEPETGYKFDVTDDNYSITINGVEPDPISSFGMERRGYWIEYDCLAEVGNADFYAVDPAVGHHTYYDVVCNNNPGVELKATKVLYYDASERMSYSSTTAFEEGHYYELEFRIKANRGYIFTPGEDGKPDISKLTVNGNPITDASYYAPDKSEITITCVYDALKKDVKAVPVVPDKNEQINGVLKYVKVYDIAEPKAGESPDVEGVVLSRRYDIPHLVANKIDFIWTNVTDGKEMDPKNDNFENGKEYQVQVGVSGYDFSSLGASDKAALKGYINGKEADEIKFTDWGILLSYNFGVLGEKQETAQPEKEPEKPTETEKPQETEKPSVSENTQETQKTSFTDVSKDQYYYDAVMWAVEQGITSGTSATTFSPNASCTRAQVVTFLHRMVASPEPAAISMPFTDVKSDAYYYKPIKWAVGSNITGGTSATTFSPDVNCTRAQVVTFLWRTAGKPEPKTDKCNFADVKADSYYYKAVLWAVENGITGGTSATTFSPDVSCTRGQVVTFLWRFIVK